MCLNLLNNAVKYTKAGGKIRLAVREEDIPVPDRAGEGQPAGRSDGDGRVMLKRKSMGKFLVVWLSLAALLWIGLAQSAFAAYIPAMSRETTFAVTLALTAAKKQSDTVSDVGGSAPPSLSPCSERMRQRNIHRRLERFSHFPS